MPGRNTHGCCRGIFGLESWDPLPRPGKLGQEDINGNEDKPNRNHSDNITQQTEVSSAKSIDVRYKNSGTATTQSKPPPAHQSGPKGTKLLAAFSYSANPDSPLGKELTIKQGMKLFLVSKRDKHWWDVVTEDGEQGHVPSNYVLVLDEKPTSLPWLANRKSAAEEEPVNQGKFAVPKNQAVYKPYKATYDHSDRGLKSSVEKDEKDFYCRVCEKKFNGPIPYSSHMNSKQHKEEVEIAKEYGREV